MELQNAKGTRDFLPEEKIARNKILETLKEVFELYGFSPLETPAIESYEVLASKYAGGADILQETFRFKDRGNRDLALRYDLTVPFARVVGMNPQLKMPFKRYQMDKVWRDGPIGLGRYREFWQCDADVVGAKSMMAEAEILSMVNEVFKRFGLKIVIYVNNRKLLNGLLDKAGVKEKEAVILALDKLKKIGREGVKDELKKAGFSDFTVEDILEKVDIQGKNEEVLAKAKAIVNDSKEGIEGINELEEILAYAKLFGVDCIKVDLSLARGLVFYTGPVFETFLIDNPIQSAVASGGRYDKIIGKFLESKEEYPATGISFGLDRIYDALKAANKLKEKKTVTEAFVVGINETEEAIKSACKLRELGVKTEVDIAGKSLRKNLEYVNAKGIPFIVFIGETEKKMGQVKLRDATSGKETMQSLEETAKIVKKHLSHIGY